MAGQKNETARKEVMSSLIMDILVFNNFFPNRNYGTLI
jgi:hypothetical protein